MTITKNRLKALRELSIKKNRIGQGRFIVEGMRLTQEAVGSDFEITEAIYTQEFAGEEAGKKLLEHLRRKTRLVEQVTVREMKTIADTVTAQGIVAVVRQKSTSADKLLLAENVHSTLIALDGIADPGNLGSMIRTGDWFGVSGVLLGQNCVELYNPKVLRGTMGGVFHLPIAEDVDLLSTISRAKELGYQVYATDAEGEMHFDRVQFANKALIVFGNEAWGISDQVKQLADVRVAIRRYGSAESLNVGVACGIILSALHKLYNE